MVSWLSFGTLASCILTAIHSSAFAERCDWLKALHFDKDGFVLLYKRLDSGRFQWPRNSEEVRNLTRQEFR